MGGRFPPQPGIHPAYQQMQQMQGSFRQPPPVQMPMQAMNQVGTPRQSSACLTPPGGQVGTSSGFYAPNDPRGASASQAQEARMVSRGASGTFQSSSSPDGRLSSGRVTPGNSGAPPVAPSPSSGVLQRPSAQAPNASLVNRHSEDQARPVSNEATGEADNLRRAMQRQEEQISQLRSELEESRSRSMSLRSENERLGSEVKTARAEVSRLVEELHRERQAREDVEATAAKLRSASRASLAAARAKAPSPRSPARESLGRHTPSRGGPPEAVVPPVPPPQTDAELAFTASSSTARYGTPREQRVPKDDIDARLLDFLDRADCGLVFRRMNRGWYAFRRSDDRGPRSEERPIEISIVNGKLLVRLEVNTYDPGWNNGKFGPIQRFVAAMS